MNNTDIGDNEKKNNSNTKNFRIDTHVNGKN